MTTLGNRPNTALVVVDVQNDVMAAAVDREAVVGTIAGLVASARTQHVPVVWVQHDDEDMPKGEDGWQIVPELHPDPAEARVEKEYGDAFEAIDLEAVLAKLQVGSLVVVGAQTDACIRSTLHGALVRGYDTFLVGDAHTTEDLTAWGAPTPEDVVNHTNLYWQYQRAPGREAGVVTTAELDFAEV